MKKTFRAMKANNQLLAAWKKRKDPPPDPEEMNDKRSEWASRAVREFMIETGVDLEDAVCDLIADLHHFCDRHGLNFQGQLDRGLVHYEEETSEDDQGQIAKKYLGK